MKRRLMILGGVVALVVALVGVALVAQAPTNLTHRWVLDKNNVAQPIPLTVTERETLATVLALQTLPPETKRLLWNRKYQAAIDSGLYAPAEVAQIRKMIALNDSGFFKAGRLNTKAEAAAYAKSHWKPALAVLGTVKFRELFFTPPPAAWVRQYARVDLGDPRLDTACPASGPSDAALGRQDYGTYCACSYDEDCRTLEYCCNSVTTCSADCTKQSNCGPSYNEECFWKCKGRGAEAPSPAPRPVPHAPPAR